MFIEVLNAKYLGDYKIYIIFNNGISKTVDLSDKLNGSIFEPLKIKLTFNHSQLNIIRLSGIMGLTLLQNIYMKLENS